MNESAAAEPRATPTTETTPRSRVQRWRATVKSARGRLDDKRETSATVSVAFDTLGEDFRAGGPVLAAALGFRVFLFFVPFVAFALIILGFIGDLFSRNAQDLIRGRGIAGLTASGISTGQNLSTGTRVTSLILVAYALFLSARSFVKVLHVVHMLLWRNPPAPPRKVTRASLLFIGIVSAVIVLSGLIDALRTRNAISGFIALALYTFIPFFAWWLVSWWLPHGTSDRLGLVPGAAVFAVGTEALHIATVIWFPHKVESKSEVYGAIGIALALLLWAYLLGRLITFSAALNIALWVRRDPKSPPRPGFVAHVPLVGDRLERAWTWLITPPASPPGDG
jgi:uncharacterized BrkB/YihY/UPF0761 family membrane protein